MTFTDRYYFKTIPIIISKKLMKFLYTVWW